MKWRSSKKDVFKIFLLKKLFIDSISLSFKYINNFKYHINKKWYKHKKRTNSVISIVMVHTTTDYLIRFEVHGLREYGLTFIN